MIKFLLCCSIAMAMIACGGASEEERKDGFSKKASSPEDSLFDEVMHGHDTAMAKMGKLSRYQKEVQRKIDSLNKKGSSAKASVQAALKQLKSELATAEEGMNQWMDDFSIDSAQDNIERRIDYLKSEKIKVDDVKEKIFRTLDKADSLLKNN